MRLLVVSHKLCWPAAGGIATDGGFPRHMEALSWLFDETVLALPCLPCAEGRGGTLLCGRNLRVARLTPVLGRGALRKLGLPFWVRRNLDVLLRELDRADAVHAPVPGDVGTVGMLLAMLKRKPLFVRHCGNWRGRGTLADRTRRRIMERIAGGRNVVMATGAAVERPSRRNPAIDWVFSTSLRSRDIRAMAHRRSISRAPGPRLITVGRQVECKGTGLVLEMLALPACRGLRLDVVGDGTYLPVLRELARRLAVEKRVTFHGEVELARVPELLAQADLFVFPTRCSEGFPKVVVEALAAGLPVVASTVSAIPAILAGGGGVVLERPSAQTLAEAVLECLEDGGLYAERSLAALETARALSLERWSGLIGARLEAAWGPLEGTQ